MLSVLGKERQGFPLKSNGVRSYAKGMAERFNLRYEEMDGNTNLLERMIARDWREDFVVTEPGQEISFERFMDGP